MMSRTKIDLSVRLHYGKDDAEIVVHVNNQPVFVIADIEDDSVIGNETCVSISAPDCLRVFPIRNLSFSEPGLLRIRMALPKSSKHAPGDNPHITNNNVFP